MKANLSFWEKSCFLNRPNLIVVGAGIVGLCAAIFYKKDHPEKEVVIFDRELLPKGASTRNAGFACFGSITELISDFELQGKQLTLELIAKRWNGLQMLRTLVGDENMDYQHSGGYELFLQGEADKWKLAHQHLDFINAQVDPLVNQNQTFTVSDQSFNFGKTLGIIFNKAEGQLHPGKMIQQLLSSCAELGIKILRGHTVVDIISAEKEIELKVMGQPSFFSDQVLLATNGFSQKLVPTIDLKPARNQVLLTAPIPNLKLKGCYHYDQGYIYFRNVGNRVLLGGGRHWDKSTEETAEYGSNDLIKNRLLEFLKTIILPDTPFEIEYEWSGILGVGQEKEPIIKKIDQRLAVAIRMGGMGVAIGCQVGKKAAEMLAAN